ncbi:MAG: hypothetical protein ACLFVY_11535, partial [Phycisphaerae bacterium]
MPKTVLPTVPLHKSCGQTIVTLAGRTLYLGRHARNYPNPHNNGRGMHGVGRPAQPPECRTPTTPETGDFRFSW